MRLLSSVDLRMCGIPLLLALASLTAVAGCGGEESAAIEGVTVEPAVASVQAGGTVEFTATCQYSDGSNTECTEDVVWLSSDPTLAGISNAVGSRGVATGVSEGAATISAIFGESEGTAALTITGADLVRIEVIAEETSIPVGFDAQFTAMCSWSDGKETDCTVDVTWSSDASSVVISNAPGSEGLASAVSPGVANITATLDTQTATVALEVTDASVASIEVTPPTASIAAGHTIQFTATCTFSDGTDSDCTAEAIWASTDTSIAWVSTTPGSEGEATGSAQGTADIIATLQGHSGSATLTVTPLELVGIEVIAEETSIPAGFDVQFTAMCSWSYGQETDCTADVTWSSDASNVVISNAPGSEGLADTLSPGTANITAALDTQTAMVALEVTDASVAGIEVAPPTASVTAGYTTQFTATCTFSDGSDSDCTSEVIWASTDTSIAWVSTTPGTEGLATGRAQGVADIVAALQGHSGSATLTVTPLELVGIEAIAEETSIPAGFDVQFTAMCSWSDGQETDCTVDVTWSSDTSNVVISNAPGSEGLASTLSPGVANITAALGAETATVMLEVTDVSLAGVAVTPPTALVAAGYAVQFSATCTFSDGSDSDCTDTVIWASSDTSIAWVSTTPGTEGEATGRAQGVADIIATLQGYSGSATLTVDPPEVVTVEVSPSNASVPDGLRVYYTANCYWSDGSDGPCTTDVTWSTGNAAIATVSNMPGYEGRVTGRRQGFTTVIAELGGVTGSANVRVTAPLLNNIVVTPANPDVVAGLTLQFAATCYWTNGDSNPCTTTVTWTPSDNLIALVDNTPGNEGMATGLIEGVVTIFATQDGVTGSTRLTVTPAELVDITVTPDAWVVTLGFFLQFTATGEFTDGSFDDITDSVFWSSENDNVASVENSPGQAGRAFGVDPTGVPNPVLITATDTQTGVFNTAQLTVVDYELCSISVFLSPPSVAGVIKVEAAAQANAIGHFCLPGTSTEVHQDDITAHDVLIWTTTAAPQYGDISNAVGSKGWFRALQVFDGWFEIQASLGGYDGVTPVYIREKVMAYVRVDLDLNNRNSTIGLPFQASCTAINEDLEEFDVTTDPDTLWDSPLPLAAFVDQDGVVTPLGTTGGVDFSAAQVRCFYSPGLPDCPPSGTCVGVGDFWVHDCVVDSMAVEPADVTVANGQTQQFTALGDYVYSPGTPSEGQPCVGAGEATFDVTGISTWTSLDNNVAIMVDPIAQPGLVQVVTGDGRSTTIQAELDSVLGETTIYSSP